MHERFDFNMTINDLIKVTASGEDFREHMAISNIQRLEVMTKIIIILEIILSLMDLASDALSIDSRFKFNNYLAMYLLMIIVCLLVSITTRYLKKHSIHSYKKMESLVVFYSTFVVCWGSVVSLMDQRLYGSLTAFIVNMLFTSILLQSTKSVLFSYFTSTVLLMAGLPIFQKSHDILIGHYINVSIFIVISWFISRALFYFYYNDFEYKKKMEETNKLLQELSLSDELTGIANRRSLNEYIDFCKKLKKGTIFSVIMMDIDFFKYFNDTYGHNLGDSVLCLVAKEINKVAEDSLDFAARFGGEEFMYIAINSDIERIMYLAETIKLNVANLKIPHSASKVSDYITLSLGVATITLNSQKDIHTCMDLSDKALYTAKDAGRNCVKKMEIA